MKIIIPMSGYGERFRRAGYLLPKPLIAVEHKPIIAHVIDMFPHETDFIFICNKNHLTEFPVEETIIKYCPTGKIIGIEPHKLGPVYAVSQIFDYLEDEEPTIINYCDFTCYWDYEHFKYWVKLSNCDGCVPAYRNFHPHSIHGSNYAFMKEKDGWLLEIQEKQSFTQNKMTEFASSGTYYFAKGTYVKDFFTKTIEQNILVNQEYYCSVVYNLMIKEGLNISVYELEHFMQWGTPEDLWEYQRLSDVFRSLSQITQTKNLAKDLEILPGTTLIPLAGKGSRFQIAGYDQPKPLIPVSGKAMVIQATQSLPKTEKYVFVCLQEHLDNSNIEENIKSGFANSIIVTLEQVTNGQAITCLAALEHLDLEQPVTISACDHGVIFNREKFLKIWNNSDIDCIVWVTRGHPSAIKHPEMYGWVMTKNNQVINISVKTPLDNPKEDPIIIGTFTFKTANIFKSSVEKMLERKAMINGEYYIDTCINDAINLGYNCVIFEVDHYLGWGTPNDLKTFEYWQSCFHKWKSHPYRCERDPWISPSQRQDYSKQIRPMLSPLPLINE